MTQEGATVDINKKHLLMHHIHLSNNRKKTHTKANKEESIPSYQPPTDDDNGGR